MTDTPETVVITAERLKQLEEAEMRLSSVEEKLKKRNHQSIDRLNAYNKAHPEKAAERVKRYKDKDRAEYNAKRREQYHQRKIAVLTATSGVGLSPAVVTPN